MNLSQLPGIRGQRDARWANVELGFNTDPAFNLYHYGCLVVSIANMLWAMDRSNLAMDNPGLVNQALKERGGFEPGGGNVVWSVVPQLDNDVRPQGVTSDIHTLASWLAADNHYALVHVTGPGFPMHWLMGYGVQPGGEPLALDPWYADSCAVRGRYTFVEAHLYGDATPLNLTPQPTAQAQPALPTPPVEAPVQEVPTATEPTEPTEPVQPEPQLEPESTEAASSQQWQVAPVTVRKDSSVNNNSLWSTTLGQWLLGLGTSAVTTLATQLTGNGGPGDRNTILVAMAGVFITHLNTLLNFLHPSMVDSPSEAKK